ncbi:MAG: hypothetical protein HDR26_00975 [Lachnospiraceae bacterium]|nr:hypothetical protein [Lachnospiraceae bacterium]
MKKEEFFEILGELDEDIIQDAREPVKKKTGWKIWGAAAGMAAALTLALGFGLGGWGRTMRPDHFGSQAGNSGHEEGSLFMSYAGPVLPMTAMEGGGDISAQRTLIYDFSLWDPVWQPDENGGGRYRSSTDLLVTDTYTLTNLTGEAKTLTLLYPFASSLWDLPENMPMLTADGTALQISLRAGGAPGGFAQTADNPEDTGPLDLTWLDSWEHYRALLSDGRYRSQALKDFPDLSSIPVTVYRFTNAVGPEADEKAGCPNPSIRAGFHLDYDKTTVLSYGFNGASYDREAGSMIQEFSIPQPGDTRYDRPCYLFVIGDDIRDMTTGGYVTGGTDPDTSPLPGCSVEVEHLLTDLESALREAAEWMYDSAAYSDYEQLEGKTDFALYFGLMKEYLLSCGPLSQDGPERYGTGWLADMNFTHADRVFYLETSVTIPAGGSITVAAQMTKKASYDFYCAHTENQGVYGYDLVTRLDSCLRFTKQTAETVHTDSVEFVRQNYGFDLPGGVTSVTLDPAAEHYYLEVRSARAD